MEGGEEAGADGGGDAGVGGEGGVEVDLGGAAVCGLEGLEEEAAAVDQGAQLAVDGKMAGYLVLRDPHHLSFDTIESKNINSPGSTKQVEKLTMNSFG